MNDISVLGIIVLILGFLSSFFVIFSFIPLTFRLLKTKQTHSLSGAFSFFMIVTGIFWVTYSILLLVSAIQDNRMVDGIIAGVPILLTNLVGIISHFINLVVKFKMINGAKKNNLSEKEYCDLVFNKKNARK